MRIVFMGSADLSGVMLEALLQTPGMDVAGVITQPDRPSGRSRQPQPCPCKARATARSLPVLSPEKVNHPDVRAQVEAWSPDVAVVVAYGQFLGRRLLTLPRLGCVNIHLSLLPKFRGAAPIQWAVAAGETRTGVTAMLMDEGMDSGDILMQAEEPVLADDTAGTLHDRLALLGARVLCDTLPRWAAGELRRMPQDPAGVTLAPKLHKHDGLIDWSAGAGFLDRRVRAFNPWPACYTWLPRPGAGKNASALRLKVLRVTPLPGHAAHDPACRPGTLGETGHGDGPLVRVGDGAVRLLEVQPEAGKPMSGRALVSGYRLRDGELFVMGQA